MTTNVDTSNCGDTRNSDLKRLVRGLVLIPVWLLANAMMPILKKDHEFKHNDMSLNGWIRNTTGLALMFGVYFWISIPTAILVGVKYFIL